MGTWNTPQWNTGQWGGSSDAVPAQLVVRTDIIYYALRLIRRVQRPGTTPSDPEVADVLGMLNGMLDSWNTERRIVWAMVAHDIALTPGKDSYAIGLSQWGTVDIDLPRPSRIDAASMVLLQPSPGQPIELFMNKLEWNDWQLVPLKNTPSTLATSYYYDQANPIGNIHLFPVPNVANLLRLYLWQTLSTFTSADDSLFLPQGYLRAIRYNLAVEIVDMFEGATLSANVARIAAESKLKIKSLNQPPMGMASDPAATVGSGGRYNFYTDQSHR